MNPSMVGFAMVDLSWKGVVDFNEALVNYELGFPWPTLSPASNTSDPPQ